MVCASISYLHDNTLNRSFYSSFFPSEATAGRGFLSEPGGDRSLKKTARHTAATPAAPMPYATSRPAHQYTLVNSTGPSPLPTCPQLRSTPSLPPLSPSCASKLLSALRPVTTVADVAARHAAATYSADS